MRTTIIEIVLTVWSLFGLVSLGILYNNARDDLQTCYNSGFITSPEGKVFHCVWQSSDSWAEKQEGEPR